MLRAITRVAWAGVQLLRGSTTGVCESCQRLRSLHINVVGGTAFYVCPECQL